MAAHEHVHRLAATDRPENYPTRDALIAAQRARCPVCAGHDHTDTRPFGFDQVSPRSTGGYYVMGLR